uniref:Uncharacterized protein n=1 Tax=Knipowitschia caucasica TaxID=637954 RepID=A0AAV2M0V3_KNICA
MLFIVCSCTENIIQIALTSLREPFRGPEGMGTVYHLELRNPQKNSANSTAASSDVLVATFVISLGKCKG